MYKDNIVITDIEVLLPSVMSFEEFENYITNKMTATIGSLALSNESKPVYRIDRQYINTHFSPRIRKKRDDFSLFSQIITDKLIKKTNLKIDEKNEGEIGVIVGNCTGGWSYVEPQLIEMYREGLEKLNSYVATAWFPTASQGEISINHGIKGYSKTICADRLSGGLAIKHAFQTISNGKCKTVLAGGVEAPLTPLVYNALNSEDGILSEGGIFTVIESFDEAIARGKKPLARILGIKCSATFNQVITSLIEEGNNTCDYIFNHKLNKCEFEEFQTIISKFPDIFDQSQNISCEFNCGNLLAVEVPLAIALTLNTLKDKTGQTVLINTSDQNGQVLSLFLEII